jgi:acyl carrier protein
MLTPGDILSQLTIIFRDILDNKEISLNDHTTADDIEEWDSLSHIQLIVGIEKHFRIRFKTAEITTFKNVGELHRSIQSKLSQ